VNWILRGVRVIDPAVHDDVRERDVWLRDGRIVEINSAIRADGAPVIDLTPARGGEPCVLCPGFIDIHAHLREPGGEDAETIASGAEAAAAGGFTHVVGMANTAPPVDTPPRVKDAIARASNGAVQVLTTAALTRALAGHDLVDIAGCADAGAVAFSDDGRNTASEDVLAEGLRLAAAVSRPVLVHPEDEAALARLAGGDDLVVRGSERPAWVETRAVEAALAALSRASAGRLHLQHITTEESVELVRRAKAAGAPVTAEVTPHHLSLPPAPSDEEERSPLRKVNPPLRGEQDRLALIDALRGGTIDCVATDHAPHPAAEKALPYEQAAPGMIGLETALAVCNMLGGMGGEWLPTLVERLTSGPHRVLGSERLQVPRLRVGETADCVLFDPDGDWVVGEEPLRSRSQNTPLLGARLRGRILLTIAGGVVVYREAARIPVTPLQVAHG